MRRLGWTFAACSVLLVLSPSPASASCLAPPGGMSEEQVLRQQLADARVVFVGTVVGVRNNGRTAAVKVENVWKGPALPSDVTVHGGPDQVNAITSVDRNFENGRRYLFFPQNERPPFTDNACSPTREFTPELAAFGPEGGGTTPTAAENTGGTPGWVWVLVGGLVVIGGGIAILVINERRSR